MKKQILSILLIILVIFPYSAQKLDIDWGESFDSQTDVQKILGFSNNTMIAFSTKGKKKYIEHYDESGFKQIASNVYEVPDLDGYNSGLLNITIKNDKILAIVYGYSKKTKSFILYAQMMNPDAEQIGKLIEIYKSEEVDERIKDAIVDVRFSMDNKKMLVFFDRSDKDRLTFSSDAVLVDLTSSDFKPTVERLKIPMRDGKSENVDFKMTHSVENEGNHFFISQKIEFTKKVISNFELNVTGYNNSGEKIGESKITDKESVLLNPAIITVDKGFTVVGYYMNNPRKRAFISGYGGLFVANLNKDLSVEGLKKSEFSNEFFKDLYSERYINRMSGKGKEILVPAPYAMDNIVLHSDGTMTILSEYYLVTVTDNGKGGRTTTTNYGNIIYYKLSADGDIVASDVVKKNQVSSTTSISLGVGGSLSMFVSFETKDQRKKYWSYAVAVNDGVVYLVFNDHRKNMENEDGEISASLMMPSKGLPYLVTINPDGTFTKKAMADASDDETYCVPQITYQLDVDSFIIWGVRRKENKFGVAKIN